MAAITQAEIHRSNDFDLIGDSLSFEGRAPWAAPGCIPRSVDS
jgi:hypothetical protein